MKHKSRYKERKRETKELQDRKLISGNIKSFPLDNYFTCKWIKIPNQGHTVAELMKNKIQYMLSTRNSF